MKRCNPRCRANWIYTSRYFPAFVSAPRTVVISVISPRVRSFLPFSCLRPSRAYLHTLSLTPLRGQILRSSTHENPQVYPPRVARMKIAIQPLPLILSIFKIISFHYSNSAFYRPRMVSLIIRTLFPNLFIYFPALSKLDFLNHSVTEHGLISFLVLSTE